jgi:hypothetical protein
MAAARAQQRQRLEVDLLRSFTIYDNVHTLYLGLLQLEVEDLTSERGGQLFHEAGGRVG